MAQKRVLFVDDEPGIRQTLPAILNRHGFDVTVASRVDEALTAITSSTFDVLVSDLHIGEPGDGFVVVSAMRRTQPNCVTLILTGFPGFETALEAIRNQVDDYLIKPTPAPQLVRVIEQRLTSRKSGRATANKRLAEVLRQGTFEITQRALREMKTDAALRQLPLADEERVEHIPQLLNHLAEMLDACKGERKLIGGVHGAHARGKKRYEQGVHNTSSGQLFPPCGTRHL